MEYICKFRRNNKERYWETRKVGSLYDFKCLLEKMFEETTEQKLEITIIKVKKETSQTTPSKG